MSDDAKKVILARRARFVAAALAGLATDACGKTTAAPVDGGPPLVSTETTPQPCLVPPLEPCLSVVMPPPDAGVAPSPCLRVSRPVDAGVDCKTPYWFDADGVKHFKKECI